MWVCFCGAEGSHYPDIHWSSSRSKVFGIIENIVLVHVSMLPFHLCIVVQFCYDCRPSILLYHFHTLDGGIFMAPVVLLRTVSRE